jgi:hypothetical protein
MSQFKVYGQRQALEPVRSRLSDLLHTAAVEVLGLPADKRFHRFFPMAPEDFPTPVGRTERYTIIEVLMFTGRTVVTKKAFYARLYRDAAEQLGIQPPDLELTLLESPRHDWAIRGQPGDELDLGYRVER